MKNFRSLSCFYYVSLLCRKHLHFISCPHLMGFIVLFYVNSKSLFCLLLPKQLLFPADAAALRHQHIPVPVQLQQLCK